MKKRKFASGGQYEDPAFDYPPPQVPGTNPGVTPMPTPGFGKGGGGGAYGGLNTINQGASQVGSALKDVSGSLGQAAKAIGSPGGGGGIDYLGQQGTSKSPGMTMKKGGKVKGYAKGGSVSYASKRGDGIAQRGKTKGRMV